jgi:hypothetical protein
MSVSVYVLLLLFNILRMVLGFCEPYVGCLWGVCYCRGRVHHVIETNNRNPCCTNLRSLQQYVYLVLP